MSGKIDCIIFEFTIKEIVKMTEKTMEEVLRRLDALEKKAKITEDIEQIKQLFQRYINARTLRDSEAELACWAEDGVLGIGEEPIKGKAALAKFIEANEAVEGVKVKPVPTEGQFLVHPLVTIDGGKANGQWLLYTLFCHRITRQSLFWTQATYDADFIRENGEWKIFYIRWQPLIQPPGPPPYDLPGPWPRENE
jgi:hypothetical protein